MAVAANGLPAVADGVLAVRPVDGRRVLPVLASWLRGRVREAAGRDPEPSAGVIDAQSVHESAEGVVPAATSGFDSHKKVNGRKRHLLTDTMGVLIEVAVTPPALRPRARGTISRLAGHYDDAGGWAPG